MNEQLNARIVSSLEKCFTDDSVGGHPVLRRASMLRNERFSFQLIYRDERPADSVPLGYVAVEEEAPAGAHCTVRSVEQVATTMPVFPHRHDDDLLRAAPGLYPDLLLPLRNHGCVRPLPGRTEALWLDVDPAGDLPAGSYAFTVTLRSVATQEVLATQTLDLTVIAADLPKQTLQCTNWLHTDCLADYYHVPVFSERYWEIVEHFVRSAIKNGINMLLTPIFTPPLDTEVGGERPTVQLLDISLDGGAYRFGFERFDRWVAMAQRCGVEYFEMAHLFTQWGAAHAPKIVATVDGETRRIFGWETSATGEDYAAFLRAMLPALTAHLRELGIAERCVFHISDEPSKEALPAYKAARELVAPLLRGFPVMDALSDIDLYKSGAVTHPIPSNDHIEPFLQAEIPNLWTYYCCGQGVGVSNRFLAMPSARTRMLGVQMYKFNIAGFLHWGYNFYYSQYSVDVVDPYRNNDGDGFVPAGDTFIVYPGPDGAPLESLRLPVFADGLQDMRALQLCETLCGRQAVLELIEQAAPSLRFSVYPRGAAWLLELRERVNEKIAQAVRDN